MTGALPDAIAHDAVRIHVPSLVDDEPEVLFGGQTHHHPQPVPMGGVEQRAGRHGVGDPDGIEAVGHHLREVPFDGLEVVILVSIGVGSERAIRDAADIQFLAAGDQELAVNRRTGPRDGFERNWRRRR